MMTPADSPFAANGGLQGPAPVVQDPFDALDALMSVIEALCPVWPQRPVLAASEMLL